jgi:hypothetical protein
MADVGLNPYIFTLPAGHTLNVSADENGGFETATSMIDVTAVDIGLDVRKPFEPCFPNPSVLFPGFIWGTGTCTTCPPASGIYRNDLDPNNNDHIISLNCGSKSFICSDPNRTTVNFTLCPARVVSNDPTVPDITLAFQNQVEQTPHGIEWQITIILDSATPLPGVGPKLELTPELQSFLSALNGHTQSGMTKADVDRLSKEYARAVIAHAKKHGR